MTCTNKSVGTVSAKAPIQQREIIQILTVQQVADRLQIPVSSVYEKTRFRGGNEPSPLPCRRVGRFLRFLSSEVDAWFLGLPQITKTAKRKYQRKGKPQIAQEK
jgi:predicted DNA-binding transcriptional regulator AlpA